MRIDLPVSGMVSELLFTGIALILDYGGARPMGPGTIQFEEEMFRETMPDIIKSVLKHVSGKINASPGSGMVKNDKDSFGKTYQILFGAGLPGDMTYPEFFCDAAYRIADLIRDGKWDPVRSLKSIQSNTLGYGSYFIQPSVIKQMEFYERSTEFLRPTTGSKSMIELDPFWFSLLSMGFLWGYSGYYGGAYYLVTYPHIEAELQDHFPILKTIDAISSINVRKRMRLDNEEVYELGLSLEIAKGAESEISVHDYRWPLRLYKESVVGQAYTAEKSMDLNLYDLIGFSIRYISSWRKLDPKPTVKIKEGDKEREVPPLEGLVILAERELSERGIKGDNEMAAYLLVRDLHRAISSRSVGFMEEALYRAARKSRGIREHKDADSQLKYILLEFFRKNHITNLLEALT